MGDENYPNMHINYGATSSDSINLTVKKYGGMLTMTKEFLQSPYSAGYLNMVISKIGKAFARKKEAIVQQTISNMGKVTLFDNGTPGSSLLGSTSGRGIDGNYNNTLSPYDIMNAYVYGYTNYNVYYDVMIMHPFAWPMFMMVPTLKELLVGSNGQPVFPQQPNGHGAAGWANYMDPKLVPGNSFYGAPNMANPSVAFDPLIANKLGVDPYGTRPSYAGAQWTINPNGSGYFNHPIKVILSPTMPLAKADGSYYTDIIFASSGNIGAIFQSQGVRTREKGRTDEFEDVVKYKFDEAYGVLPYLRGEGFASIKGICLDRQYIFENVNTVELDGKRGNVVL